MPVVTQRDRSYQEASVEEEKVTVGECSCEQLGSKGGGIVLIGKVGEVSVEEGEAEDEEEGGGGEEEDSSEEEGSSWGDGLLS